MKKEYVIRILLVMVFIVIVLLAGKLCPMDSKAETVSDDTTSAKSSIPVAIKEEVETDFYVEETEACVTDEEVVFDDDVYEEETEEEYFDDTEDDIKETEEETEETDVEESEHECCNFYEEVYLPEDKIYMHECVECGEIEYFEWAEEEEEEPSEHTDDDCCEFTEPDDDGTFYCIECGQAFCFDED